MPHYRQLGDVPRKRHTVNRHPNGELIAEHLIGALGFSGPSSLLYHRRPPTQVSASRLLSECALPAEADRSLRMRHFHFDDLPTALSATLNRTPILFNADVTMSLVRPTVTDDFFYRNAQADEVIYVDHGVGVAESEFGEFAFRSGDYVVVPRGILYRLRLSEKPARLLVIETPSHLRFPRRYLTDEGQLMEHAPFCDRDIRGPIELPAHDEAGEFRIVVKQNDVFTEVILDHHPLDTVGWDGCYYPWAMSIHDFEPITGALHQPPPVHQTFQADGFVICSFTPRLFDFHPEAVPAPYNHSNVMSDEIIYYANDEFMSRSGISHGSLTLHPAGLPHGPQPGRAEASIGAKRTEELAVMLDTFRPVVVAQDVLPFEQGGYSQSWIPQ